MANTALINPILKDNPDYQSFRKASNRMFWSRMSFFLLQAGFFTWLICGAGRTVSSSTQGIIGRNFDLFTLCILGTSLIMGFFAHWAGRPSAGSPDRAWAKGWVERTTGLTEAAEPQSGRTCQKPERLVSPVTLVLGLLFSCVAAYSGLLPTASRTGNGNAGEAAKVDGPDKAPTPPVKVVESLAKTVGKATGSAALPKVVAARP